MNRSLNIVVILVGCLSLAGCSERESAGGGYTFVTPMTSGPHHHPATSLCRYGREVWGNATTAYYRDELPKRFYRDGILVFVGNVPRPTINGPRSNDWWPGQQLFAVRPSGRPVLLSERLVNEPFVMSVDSREYRFRYAVDKLAPVAGGVRVLFTQNSSSVNSETNYIALTWDNIKAMLDEADVSARLVKHELGDYRVLPKK